MKWRILPSLLFMDHAARRAHCGRWLNYTPKKGQAPPLQVTGKNQQPTSLLAALVRGCPGADSTAQSLGDGERGRRKGGYELKL